MSNSDNNSKSSAGPRIAVVGLPGKWSTEILADALAARTGYRRVVDLGRVRADLTAGRVCCEGEDLCELDGIIVKKLAQSYSPAMFDRLELLRMAEAAGVRVFSRPASIGRLIDRLSCTVGLRAAGIPMPETTITEDVDIAVEVVRDYGEAVLKPLYSTKARGMTLVGAQTENLREQVQAYADAGNPVIYIQKRIELPDRDLGVVFLGGEYYATYARVRKGDTWNTTTQSGGHYEGHEASEELIELARRAQAPFNLDFTAVDIAVTPDGPTVFEVSAFGGFRGLQEGCGVDAASAYAEYAVAELRQRKESSDD